MRVGKALLVLGILPLFFIGRLSWAGELHDAAGAGDFETVKKLLDDGASVNEKTVAMLWSLAPKWITGVSSTSRNGQQ